MKSVLFVLALSLLSGAARAQQPLPTASQSPAAGPAQIVAPTNPDPRWKPTEAQQQRVVTDTMAYFSARDERRFADAYARFSAGRKAVTSPDQWRANMERFYSASGTLEARTIRRVTWYQNPGNAQPGIYAAVDFSSQFSELSLHCGFIAWRQQMDGSFELVREEENFIPKAEAAKLSPNRLREIRTQFGC
jgi:hypothetical protein